MEKFFTPDKLRMKDEGKEEVAGLMAVIAADKKEAQANGNNGVSNGLSAWRKRMTL